MTQICNMREGDVVGVLAVLVVNTPPVLYIWHIYMFASILMSCSLEYRPQLERFWVCKLAWPFFWLASTPLAGWCWNELRARVRNGVTEYRFRPFMMECQ